MSNITNNQVRVWDPLFRLFHWSLVLTFFISYFTGDDENQLHIYAGYAVLGLIIFRLIWGIIGSKHARFSDFLASPGKVIEYLKSLVSGKPKHYLGHNPAGGWMVIVLLISLYVTTISGLKLYAVEEGKGPLAGVSTDVVLISSAYADKDEDEKEHGEGYEEHNGKDGEREGYDFWEEIHEVSSNFTLFLIFLHVAGVVVSSKLHNENLVKAMISGNKNA
jgi:cytochrome b